MLIRKIVAAALVVSVAVGLLLQVETASAARNEAYYTTRKISDYKKGAFAILADDDVNFRSGPSTTSAILACLPRHSLFRVLGGKNGEWQKDRKSVV